MDIDEKFALKDQILDVVDKRIASRGDLLDGRIEYLGRELDRRFDVLSGKLADIFHKNDVRTLANEERIRQLEGELKAAMLLVHEMKGRLDVAMSFGELPRSGQHRPRRGRKR